MFEVTKSSNESYPWMIVDENKKPMSMFVYYSEAAKVCNFLNKRESQ